VRGVPWLAPKQAKLQITSNPSCAGFEENKATTMSQMAAKLTMATNTITVSNYQYFSAS
jgi:hypothetical protein